jgi:hypothetical protein
MAQGAHRLDRPVHVVEWEAAARTHWEAACAWWQQHRGAWLGAAVVLLAVSALIRLGTGFYVLLWDQGWWGAIDLRNRSQEVHAWFAGAPVYRTIGGACYPPASYALLWPFMGWLPLSQARWLWALTFPPILAGLGYLTVRASEAATARERLFVALLLLSSAAVRSAIASGQLGFHVLLSLLAGLFFLRRQHGGWQRDALAAAAGIA